MAKGNLNMDLKDRFLTEIPEHVYENKNVNWIIFSNNLLKVIPTEIKELVHLTRLAFNDNRIHTVQPGLGTLKSLTWMDFTRNRLSTLPDDIADAKNLTGLGLSENLFEEIPECIYKLTNLRKFGFFSNRIVSLSPGISNLKHLVKMDLSNNRLEYLPDELCACKELTWLNLSSNKLKRLPAKLNNLVHLEELGLGMNELEELPDLSGLSKLRILPIFKNKIKYIKGLKKLYKLEKLDCSENMFTELPLEVLELPNLKYLNMRSNFIKEINLEKVFPITTTGISMIDVSDNHLTYLPLKFFKTFSNLATIRFQGNPFSMNQEEIPRTLAPLFHTALTKALNLKNQKNDGWNLQHFLTAKYICDGCKSVFVNEPYTGYTTSSFGDGYTFVIKRYLCSLKCYQKEIQNKR